jgi:hypothetical protein
VESQFFAICFHFIFIGSLFIEKTICGISTPR